MFVNRDENGEITGIFAVEQIGGHTEELPDDHPDVLDFIQRTDPANRKPDVSAAQLIRALDELGILAEVDAAVSQSDALTQRLWARAGSFGRKDQMVVALATALGRVDELDEIFDLAASKTA